MKIPNIPKYLKSYLVQKTSWRWNFENLSSSNQPFWTTSVGESNINVEKVTVNGFLNCLSYSDRRNKEREKEKTQMEGAAGVGRMSTASTPTKKNKIKSFKK